MTSRNKQSSVVLESCGGGVEAAALLADEAFAEARSNVLLVVYAARNSEPTASHVGVAGGHILPILPSSMELFDPCGGRGLAKRRAPTGGAA